MSLVLVAILGPLAVAIGAIAQIHITGEQRRADKREDWARQDEVADRLTRRQDAIAEQAREAARLLVENNHLVARTADEQGRKLTVIHTLVNSTLTEAKQGKLEALQGQLLLLERFTPDDVELIRSVRAVVSELRTELADRADQTDVANAQAAE